MCRVVLSIVLWVCACAFVDCVDHVEELKRYDEAVEKVKSLAPSVGESLHVNDKKFHYGLLVLAVDYLSTAWRCAYRIYDRDFLEIVKRAVSRAWRKPDLVARRLDKLITEVEYKISGIRSLLKTCQNNTNVTCNEIIANSTHEMKMEARHLSFLSGVAMMYFDRTFEEEAEDYTMVTTLIYGKRALTPIVSIVAETRKHLNKRGGMPCLVDDVFNDL